MSRAAPEIRVLLWFDTEDYLLPADDDAILRLATFLTKRGIRGIFKMVGEKARVLVRRGRKDVIAALSRHEIGYHTDFHSVHPTPAEYLSRLGWDEGVTEFLRREGPGYEDVRRIFGVKPACYGQPGSSWGPQTFGAMRRWGMPVYMDSGRHVGLDGAPHYYGGALTFLRIKHELRVELNQPGELDWAKRDFVAARKDLLRRGGGIVSTVYHPCEFVHQEFWDAVNFAGGRNPARRDWKLPPARTPREVRAAFDNFEAYIKYLQSFPEVRFITTGDAARLYRDRAVSHAFSRRELQAIAASVRREVSFQRHGDLALAAADVFVLLNGVVRCGGRQPVRPGVTPFGPTEPPPPFRPATASWDQVSRTAEDVADLLRRHGRIPSTVWLGSIPVSPESYLVGIAKAAGRLLAGRRPPSRITFRPARLAAADHVAEDSPQLWGWVIFPKGFRAPEMMQLAKRQAWTLKPAVRRSPG